MSNLLSSLLGQLVKQALAGGGQITREIKSIYKNWQNRQIPLGQDEYLRMINSQFKSFSKVFVVVDALDECLNDTETNTQDEFLKALNQLPEKAHILFTSRQDISIEKKVQADSKLEIQANPDDLKRYLDKRIKGLDRLTEVIENGKRKDKEFLHKALNAIVEKSQGM